MENDPNLQTENHNNQSYSAIYYTDTMQLVGILGDPPKRASRRGVELEQEWNEEDKEQIGDGGGGGEDDGVVRGQVKQQRDKEQIQSVNAALERTEDEVVIGDLPAVVLGLVLGFEGGDSRNGVEPVEKTVEGEEIVGGVAHADGGDGGPGEKRGGGEWDASEEKALEGEYDGRVLNLDPLELERGPYTDEEVGLGAEEGKGEGGGGEAEGAREEEGDLSEDEGEPHGEEGPGLEAKGVEDVGDHEAQR